jgi:phenylalanyl-tRNA synthetase alpha chain
MKEKIESAKNSALEDISRAENRDTLEQIRVKYLGRKGVISALFKDMSSLGPDEKPRMGQLLNRVKNDLLSELTARGRRIDSSRQKDRKSIDVTLPGLRKYRGHAHLVTQTIDRICEIFVSMGFRVIEGPEIETEFYNFQALNIPLEHPSRDVFDTFYLKDEYLLRSHTSPVQVRFMEKNKPPFMIAIPGKVYRPDATDASHLFMFHQVEGLAVADNIKFSDLKGILNLFVKEMFGPKTRMRFRPHFFPFTEPSVEVDVSCFICKGKGCRVCSKKGWLEILGAGMVDPNVFKYVGYDPDKTKGFAFGMGVERIALLRHGIEDIRLLFENDLRFIRQF